MNTQATKTKKTPGKAALAGWIGSAMEYYDFFIYGTAAALVFGKVFFPASEPATGVLLALATFGVGYIARPVGALFLGHLGDRFGRKRVLVLTLLLMGISTFLVGCLPSYDSIGIAAPIMLVILRLCQGFSASGEQAGANSMTLEHAPSRQRAFFTSFTLSGTQAGLILATLVFLPISAMPEEQLLSWGWRIPFWLSVVVLVVGFLIRRNIEETPVFQEERERNQTARMPLKTLFADYRSDVVRVALAAMVSTVSTVFGIFSLSYAVNIAGVERSTMLWLTIMTNIVALFAIPLWAMLADLIGRRPVYLFGVLASGLLMFPYLWSIEQHNLPLMFVLGVLMSGICFSAANGIWPAFFGEMFSTRVRLSGMAIGTQVGFALSGFAPIIAAAFMTSIQRPWLPAACLTLLACAIAALATWSARETFDVDMQDLGRDTPRDEPQVKPQGVFLEGVD
ncbi:MFS transporter [Pseudomonas kribbensis]|uniref:MFS transporter n=1 Tax=Pseudomonas kribbensis TaxID=1628086 RepID=A0A4Y8VMB2_9PSED|nr:MULTISPECIES: MFS transporter [Pseudomonas]TFH81471.1 MFS transporter [Pseudomonas kribbensis]